jgi:hypothetical protein
MYCAHCCALPWVMRHAELLPMAPPGGIGGRLSHLLLWPHSMYRALCRSVITLICAMLMPMPLFLLLCRAHPAGHHGNDPPGGIGGQAGRDRLCSSNMRPDHTQARRLQDGVWFAGDTGGVEINWSCHMTHVTGSGCCM